MFNKLKKNFQVLNDSGNWKKYSATHVKELIEA